MRYLRTEVVPLADLDPFPGNARLGDIPSIRDSVRRFGQFRPLLVREAAGRLQIVAGNHTAIAMADEGHADARVEVGEYDDDGEASRVNAADNRLAELGAYDPVLQLAQLRSFGDDYAGTGWSEVDLTSLLPVPPPAPPDDFPEVGDDLPTDWECPSCHYRWSGAHVPRTADPAADEQPAPAG